MTHILCGKGGISPNLKVGTNSFNEALVNVIAKNFAINHQKKVDIDTMKKTYPLSTKALDNIIKVFDIQKNIATILFDIHHQPTFIDKEAQFCMQKFVENENEDKILNYFSQIDKCSNGYSSRGFIYFASFVYDKLSIFSHGLGLSKPVKFSIFMLNIFKFEEFFKTDRYFDYLVEYASSTSPYLRP